jgi:redox-sensitive bicupin YhaK (pirin superfamily)
MTKRAMPGDDDVILQVVPLGFPWPTVDPFLFCAHHDDAYPPGNDRLGPAASLAGRTLGMDFTLRDGWRMYHGEVVPGFPQHPHRGFETITLARRGFIDHSDSLGAAARFGGGDVQWMTAGRGVVHSEMFPLLDAHGPNPAELFQIWLNLPRKDKLVPPHFTMLWSDKIPTQELVDDAGRRAVVTVIAGVTPDGRRPPAPPPHSYARADDSDLSVWTIRLQAGARLTLPATRATTLRGLYFHVGSTLRVDDVVLDVGHAAFARGDADLALVAGDADAEVLLLAGRPIGEPVAQHGPFVMNSAAEIRQAFVDYERTRFGGWPWERDDPVHARDAGRFARHVDGRVERPDDPRHGAR